MIFLSYDSIIEAVKDSEDEEGWFKRLNPRPYLYPFGSSEVTLPKARSVVGWVTFKASTCFSLHSTTMVHPIVVGVSGLTECFVTIVWESIGLSWEQSCAD